MPNLKLMYLLLWQLRVSCDSIVYVLNVAYVCMLHFEIRTSPVRVQKDYSKRFLTTTYFTEFNLEFVSSFSQSQQIFCYVYLSLSLSNCSTFHPSLELRNRSVVNLRLFIFFLPQSMPSLCYNNRRFSNVAL